MVLKANREVHVCSTDLAMRSIYANIKQPISYSNAKQEQTSQTRCHLEGALPWFHIRLARQCDTAYAIRVACYGYLTDFVTIIMYFL